ncbi:MAG TPA: NADP-specific glutamate dehydrogenase, partial [Halanaerobiales bacterium]|nr:NADP-specific glutamate dehydrogenase [Halanaerobiales bacterium]
GKDILISGSGNVVIYAAQKSIELGGRVIAMSDSSGFVYDPEGINLDIIINIKELKRGRIKEYLEKHPSAEYNKNSMDIWKLNCDIALPCATQNELNAEGARNLVKNGVIVVGEGANMPSTPEAVELFQSNDVLFVPGKAANAGGVATSALEMTQNSMWDSWDFDEVDKKLKTIMSGIYHDINEISQEYGQEKDFVFGANAAGFLKVAGAMLDQGVI